MSKMVERFVDPGTSIYSMTDEILIECPRCKSCASIAPHQTDSALSKIIMFAPRRLVCSQCGFVDHWAGNSFSIDPYSSPVRESYFNQPLWFQTSCVGHTLWAYNRRHLMLIEQYVRADLRQRDPKGGSKGTSLISELPEWMIVASHRVPVLKAVDKLKRKL